MYISLELTEAMGGTISVQSSLGVGTTFSMSVPLTRSQQSQETKKRRKRPQAVLAQSMEKTEISGT
jgi:hypothetical protein